MSSKFAGGKAQFTFASFSFTGSPKENGPNTVVKWVEGVLEPSKTVSKWFWYKSGVADCFHFFKTLKMVK